MRKRYLSSDFTTHNPLYHLQKGPDGTSIQMVSLKRTDGGLRYNEGLYKERNPTKIGDAHLTQQNRERKRKLNLIVKVSTVIFNEQLVRGRFYA